MSGFKRKIPTFYWEYAKHTPPEIDTSTWRLAVSGEVKRPLELSLDELTHRMPTRKRCRRFYCVNGWSLKAEWAGFDLVDFIELAEPDSSAEYLRATSIGGYEDTTRIDQLVNGGAMLVTHMNGEPLPAKRGRPMRLMIFDLYQFKGVKSLQMLEFVSEYRPGTWQTVGYDDATIQPYPHMAVDSGEDLMPDAEVLRSSANTNKV